MPKATVVTSSAVRPSTSASTVSAAAWPTMRTSARARIEVRAATQPPASRPTRLDTASSDSAYLASAGSVRSATRLNRWAMPPTCASIASRWAAVTATKNRVRSASVASMPAQAAAWPGGGAGSPSGSSPIASGEGRSSRAVTGTTPTSSTSARYGAVARRPLSAMASATSASSSTPPADSPVDATDRATERRRANQRVTRVVPGTSDEAAKPAPNTA